MTDLADAASAPAPAPVTKAQSTKRTKTRARRKARRRDGADSEDDEGSVSDASSASALSKPGPKPKAALAPLFPDMNSTTPAAWADMTDKGDVISFDEFTRGDAAVRVTAVRGRGRGGKVAREPREATEEQKKRDEDKAAARREKFKAKRKAKKEVEKANKAAAKAAAAPAAPAVAAAPVAAPTAAKEVDSSLAASTSALKLDDPPAEASTSTAPSALSADGPVRPGMPRTNRNAYTQRVAEDPKFTPRVGNFWMHDQRHYEAGSVGEGSFSGLRGMSDFWRGRGGMRGMPRGGFRGAPPPRGGRGRGRGFGFVPPVRQMSPAPSPSTGTASASTSASGPGPAPYSAKTPTSATSASNSSGHRMAEMDKLEMELANKARNQRSAASEGKWGHEGFEEFAAHEDPRHHHHHMVRGRGRGRGRGGFMRGGPPLRPMPAGVAHLPTPEASPDRSASKTEPKAEVPTTTQPTSETLIEDSGAVTVKLPGGPKPQDVDRPPSQPTEVHDHTKSPFPVFTPSNPSPVPFVGSDSGSMSSGYIPAGPMMPMHTGEFYPTGAAFRPPGPGFFAPPYRPQTFTPEPHFVPGHQRGSFSGSFSGPAPFYAGAPAHARPGSPLNPYQYGQAAYFAPAPPAQKVSIRSPRTGAEEIKPAEPTGTPEFTPGVPFYPAQAQYNPYAGGEVYYQGYWPGYEGEYGYAEYPGHGY